MNEESPQLAEGVPPLASLGRDDTAYGIRTERVRVPQRTMAENKAHDLLRKHNISLDDVKDRRTSLHHLRHIVRSEELPFDVFKTLVKMRH